MLFKRKKMIGNYEGRKEPLKSYLEHLDNNVSYETLLSHYIKNEPHTLYNMGHFYDFIKGSQSPDKILSIGIDPMKEFILIKECNFKQIDVYDIDGEAVEIGNRFWEDKSINIRYFCKNILYEEIKDNYSTILLSQMDYIFSDIEMASIIRKIRQSGIYNCYVITPSLFNINSIKPPNVFIYDLTALFFYVINGFRSNKKPVLVSNEAVFTYKRTKLHLIKLFKTFQFSISKEKVIINQNGSFNLFHFRLENSS